MVTAMWSVSNRTGTSNSKSALTSTPRVGAVPNAVGQDVDRPVVRFLLGPGELVLNVGQLLVRVCEQGLVQLRCRLLQHFGRFGRGPQIVRGARGVPAAVVRRDTIEAVLQIGLGATR
jgi:hypothetical protein